MLRILILFFFTSISSASDQNCAFSPLPEGISELNKIAIPNCITTKSLQEAILDNPSFICDKCQNEFKVRISNYNFQNTLISAENKSKRKQLFAKLLIDEYKKTLTENLFNIAKLRSIPTTGATFSKTILNCSSKKNIDLKDCGAEGREILTKSLNDMDQLLANELSNILSNPPSRDKSGILNRSSSNNLCKIPEKDIILAKNRALEESIKNSDIEKIKSLDYQKFKSIDELLESVGMNNLVNLVKTHPLFYSFIKKPDLLITAAKSSKDVNEFLKKLYSPETGDTIDSLISSSCQKSFDILKKSICSSDFEKDQFNLDLFNNSKKIKNEFQKDSPKLLKSDHITSEDLLRDNLKYFSFCENKKYDLKVNDLMSRITENLDNEKKDISFSDYSFLKYQEEVSDVNDSLCEMMKNNTPCIEDSIQCKIFKNYQEITSGASFNSKLANSSNEEINKILRSMLGNPSNLPEGTRKTLVAQGILPQPDGQIVKQPQVPERQLGFFGVSANTAAVPVQAPQPQTFSSATSNPRVNSQTAAPVSFTPTSPEVTEGDSPVESSQSKLNSDMVSNMQKLADINGEIARQLLKGKSSNSNYSVPDVKKAIEEILKRQGAEPLQPGTPDKLAENFINSYNSSLPKIAGASFDAPKLPTASPTFDPKEQYAKKMNQALADFGKGSNNKAADLRANNLSLSVHESSNSLPVVKIKSLSSSIENELSKILLVKVDNNEIDGKKLVDLVKNRKQFLVEINGIKLQVSFEKDQFEQDQFKIISSNKAPINEKVLTEFRTFVETYLPPRKTTTTLEALKTNLSPN